MKGVDVFMEIKIKDLYTGQAVIPGQLFCVLSSVECATTTTSSQYYKVTFSDSTGTISGTLWSNKFTPATVKVCESFIETMKRKKDLMLANTPEALEELKKFAPVVVKVAGSVSEYKGKLQFDVTSIEETDKNPNEYLFNPISEENAMKLRVKLGKLINELEDEDAKAIVHLVLNDAIISRDFFTFPAAVGHHHAYRYGLLFHTVQVIIYTLAEYDSSKTFHEQIGVSRDVALLTALFHDLGKIEEYYFFPDNTISYNEDGTEHQASSIAIVREILAAHGLRNMHKEILGKVGKSIYEHHGVYGDEKAFNNSKSIISLLVHNADNLSAKTAAIMEAGDFATLLNILIEELIA